VFAGSAAGQLHPREPDVITLGGIRYYKVEGRLVDGSGERPLFGIQVQLVGMKGAPVASSVTDRDGMFAFYRIHDGSYTLTFSVPGRGQRAVPLEITGGPILGMVVNVDQFRPRKDEDLGSTLPVWATHIPDPARAAYEGGIKALQEKNRKQALDLFGKAVQLYPEFATAHSARGSILVTENDQAAAAAAFERALEIDPNLPDACLGLGAIYRLQKRYADAAKHLSRARLLQPEDWRVHYELGETYLAANELALAEESLRQALSIHASFARTHLLLINALALQEKYPETLTAMDEYLLGFPKDSFAPQVRKKRDLLRAQLGQSPPPPQ